MASASPIDFAGGLQDLIDSLHVPLATLQAPVKDPLKSSVRLDVNACYDHLKNSTDVGVEDAVMREALDLYCSLMSPPTTPLRAPHQEHHQNHPEPEDQYCSMSIFSSYVASSPSPRSTSFNAIPSNDYSLSYPRELAYNMSTPSLSACEHGTTDIEELSDSFAHHSSARSLLSKSHSSTGQFIFPTRSTQSFSGSDLSNTDDDEDDDPFARSPGVSRAPTPHNLQRHMSCKSISTGTSYLVNVQLPSSQSAEISSAFQHNRQLRAHPEQTNFVFPQAAPKTKASPDPSHFSATSDFGHSSPHLHILPRSRKSSAVGLAVSSTAALQPTHTFDPACGPTMIPTAPVKVTRAPSVAGNKQAKSHRARAMSVVSFSRHRRSDQTSAVPPPPIVIDNAIAETQFPIAIHGRKARLGSGPPVQAKRPQSRNRSKTLSNSQNMVSDDLNETKAFNPEEDEGAKVSLKSIRKDGKSLWKTLRRRTSRISTDQIPSEILEPVPERFDKQIGRENSGSEMRHPMSTPRPSIAY